MHVITTSYRQEFGNHKYSTTYICRLAICGLQSYCTCTCWWHFAMYMYQKGLMQIECHCGWGQEGIVGKTSSITCLTQTEWQAIHSEYGVQQLAAQVSGCTTAINAKVDVLLELVLLHIWLSALAYCTENEATIHNYTSLSLFTCTCRMCVHVHMIYRHSMWLHQWYISNSINSSYSLNWFAGHALSLNSCTC